MNPSFLLGTHIIIIVNVWLKEKLTPFVSKTIHLKSEDGDHLHHPTNEIGGLMVIWKISRERERGTKEKGVIAGFSLSK